MKCLVYTDLLLDDLCALEYLSKFCQSVIIVAVEEEDLADSKYGSRKMRSLAQVQQQLEVWFREVTLLDQTMLLNEKNLLNQGQLSIDSIYSLAPLTRLCADMKRLPMLETLPLIVMGGSNTAADGIGLEYNASADKEAYRYVIDHAKKLHSYTTEYLKQYYQEHGIPCDVQYLAEYRERMKEIHDVPYCPDLLVSYLENPTDTE